MSNLARISDHERFEARELPEPDGKGAQLEDGYVRTATAIVEAFAKAPLTSREGRVIRAVERATFGWQRSSARLSQDALAKMTGLTPKRCSEAVNGLIRKKVLFRDGGSRSPIGINTKVSEWDFQPEKSRVTPKQTDASNWGHRPQDGVTERPQDGDTYKDRKDRLLPNGSNESSVQSKKTKRSRWGEEIDHELTSEFVAAVSTDLDAPVKHAPAAWANEFRLMRQRDGRTVEQIRYLINWTAKDEFWSTVILSPAKLRAKWDQLAKRVKSEHRQKPRSGGRLGMAQPKPQGSYTPTDMDNLPDWMRD